MTRETTTQTAAEARSLWVPGDPMVKRRPLGLGLNRRGQPHYVKQDPSGWEDEVTVAWVERYGRTDLTEPLSVSLDFYTNGVCLMVEPYTGTDWRTGRGDLDNYVKAVLDALNVVAWQDDHQVVRLSAAKHKGANDVV